MTRVPRDEAPTLSKDVAERSTILRAEIGSSVHGLNIESGDRDEMGVCVEPADYVIGLRHFEQYIHRTQPKGVRSGPGDLDVTIYSLRKFCLLASKGNPSILALLFVPDSACTVLTETGQELRERHDMFASKQAGKAFLGYMQQQRQRLTGEGGGMRVNRPELIKAHGYDTKYASHILRLGVQGIDYLTTGQITIPMENPWRADIVAVRRGHVSLNTVLSWAGVMERDLKGLLDTSPLPEVPDHERVNEFLIDAYMTAWA